MSISTLFVDLDDTLYPSSTGVWKAIRQRIDAYICDRFSLPLDQALLLRDEMFHKYGTTMRGLQVVYNLNEEDYLKYVHDVPLRDYLSPNPQLKTILSELPYRKVIFTNADSNHARRVLDILGISECFEQIIDIHVIAPFCKPMPEAFKKALERMGEKPESCALIEDSTPNLITAQKMGFFTVRVGGEPVCPECNAWIPTIMELPGVFRKKEKL